VRQILVLTAASLLAACQSASVDAEPSATNAAFNTEVIGDFDEPWAMTFIPGTNKLLVTDKAGKLFIRLPEGAAAEVKGVPAVSYGGQGGLGDVIMGPDNTVYLSWVEAGKGGKSGAVVGKAKLTGTNFAIYSPRLSDLKIIWRQSAKMSGKGHFGHRLALSPDGKYLFIASGERQKFDPAQDMNSNLGKIVRLNIDGTTPTDNPFYDPNKPVQSQIWSLGHRNPLGIAFDDSGQLWNQEMGPQGGDELNLVKAKANYGYPIVSNGDHYGGRDIPDHRPGDGFEAPAVYWNPVISPSGLIYYTGDLFPEWKGSMFIGGLSSQSLVRVKIKGAAATKADQFEMGARIREVEQAPDGSIWVLEDGDGGSKGRLLRITPKK
jgi:aldose sugar dehydrogenase